MMSKCARFVVRGLGVKDGLIIGSMIGGQNVLKPGHVYEIHEIMGELVIKEIGLTAVQHVLPAYEKKPYRLPFCWSNGLSWILECFGKEMLLTESEAEKYFPTRSETAKEA